MRYPERHIRAALLAGALATGCAADANSNSTSALADSVSTPVPGAVVDSAIPIPEAIRRFQASIAGPPPLYLEGGASSMDELLRGLVAAYSARDAASLDALAITRAEFAFLYYPDSPYPDPPFRIAPDLLWYMVEQMTTRGVSRAMAYFREREAEYVEHSCPSGFREEGAGKLWGPCFVTLRLSDGREDEQRIANAIFERDGRFKLIGFDNEL